VKLLSGDLDTFTRLCREAARVKGRPLDLLEIGWAFDLARALAAAPRDRELVAELAGRLGLGPKHRETDQ
jgi:hypothetical protein